jgi:hypothetical protein
MDLTSQFIFQDVTMVARLISEFWFCFVSQRRATARGSLMAALAALAIGLHYYDARNGLESAASFRHERLI